MFKARSILVDKLKESLASVLPITGIILLLTFTIAPVSLSALTAFLVGAVMLVLGMGLFTLGAETAMTPMGERVGAAVTRSKNLRLIIAGFFLIGVIITVSEPDLTVLATQVPSIPNIVIILSVAAGVGLFLVIALMRIVIGIRLSWLLIGFYALVFILARFAPDEFMAVAFDSGGVTTGPMTVPFIMALGVGISAIRNDKHAETDSFGMVALCSIGPILAVLALSLFYHPTGGEYAFSTVAEAEDSRALGLMFARALPQYMGEVFLSLLPIIAFFAVFQAVSLKLPKRKLLRYAAGLLYTYLGLFLFLTGANVGFMPIGSALGRIVGGKGWRWVLVPIGMVIGWFIVAAEPAVHVLNRQVEAITAGAIPQRAMALSLSAGVSLSVGLAMLRVLTGVSVMWFLIPGYGLALILTFFVPKIFTAIAFDSGGVASGPMTATFLLPFAVGACGAVGGNVVQDAFGVIAMVAMTPLITIQLLGVSYQRRLRKEQAAALPPEPEAPAEEEIIEV
ncbi:MAG: DUF1538 domain-containing protein [Clostridia bacterium]|nr:DUF1538 domain-containing protein [Clostridia bacterium]